MAINYLGVSKSLVQKSIYSFVRCGHCWYFSANALCAMPLILLASCKKSLTCASILWEFIFWSVVLYLLRTKCSVLV